ncbi:MAG TPA: alpha/beta fold hydrolase [Candidatus Didemnitutus sp.]|nr:alpha/beta fold hydrolase [Candidatus Didemnitutus sp.]
MITILHGALGSAHQFEKLRSVLGVPSTVISFHGHGGTVDTNEPWSIDLFSKQLETELEYASSQGPALIFGYSMGGYVALDCALRRPDLIRRIVTLGTKLEWTREGAEHETTKLNPEVIEAKVPAFAADLALRHGKDRWKSVLHKTAELMRSLGASPVLTHERVGSLKTPVRYGIGDRDEMVTLAETVDFYKATPDAELAVVPGTRHPMERVNPTLLSHHILSFLVP